VNAQAETPDEPAASAAEYMAAMQKRLAAYQAGEPIVDLSASADPQPSMGRGPGEG
ncbi:hypothetical protein SARC_16635, partial [Sphaeroforma arctica JP610]